MTYWRQSRQNRLGLTDKDIEDENGWQEDALKMDATEGCVLSNRVHSTAGRTSNLNIVHTLSARQFRNSSAYTGVNVTVLDAAINAEKRDKQTELDQMMVREFQRHMFFLGQNAAFRYGVEGGVPIVVPSGESISTVAYEIAGAPEPESSTAIETDMPVEETQAPAVEPLPATSPTDQDETPPPPPPVSMAPARSEMRTPPPPPPPPNRPTN